MKRILLLVALILAATPAFAQEQELNVQQIVEKANYVAYYQGQDGRARVTMQITDAQENTRKKMFVILRRDSKPDDAADEQFIGDQKFYVYFMLPADERKTVFMVHKHPDGNDDRWLYLPSLDLVKQIASTEKRTSFVGSDFFYEDVSGRSLNADTHELLETTDKYYVVNNTPKDPNSVEFASYKMWIFKGTFTTVKVEYLDKNGQKYREYIAEKVGTIEGFPTVTTATMKDLRTGGQTTITYNDVKYNVGIPDDIFTERYLRIPPQEFLK